MPAEPTLRAGRRPCSIARNCWATPYRSTLLSLLRRRFAASWVAEKACYSNWCSSRMADMETVPGQWCDDSGAMLAALAELDWVTEDDLLGEDEPSYGPVVPDGLTLPLQETSAALVDA